MDAGDVENRRPALRGPIRAPQDFAAGVFLIVLAALAYWGAFDLSLGRLATMGAGMVPKVTAALVAGLGVLLIGLSIVSTGSALERWSLRGPFFVLGAALFFGWAIRPLGLAIVGPLTLIIAAYAERNVRPLELLIFAAALTTAAILLFKHLLRLPIPVWPTALPPPFSVVF